METHRSMGAADESSKGGGSPMGSSSSEYASSSDLGSDSGSDAGGGSDDGRADPGGHFSESRTAAGTHQPQQSRPFIPALSPPARARVPGLNLSLPQRTPPAVDQGAAPETFRDKSGQSEEPQPERPQRGRPPSAFSPLPSQPKVRRLSSPGCSPQGRFPSTSDAHPRGMDSSAGPSVSLPIDLISNGFALDMEAVGPEGTPPAALTERIASRCVETLGVSAQDLAFYAIEELSPEECQAILLQQQQQGTARRRRIGVCVKPSTFSLSALEDLVNKKQELEIKLEKSEAARESFQNMMQETVEKSANHKLMNLDLDQGNKRLRDRIKSLEALNKALKEEVSKSENMRLNDEKQYRMLKHQFDALSNQVPNNKPQQQQQQQQQQQLMQGPAAGAAVHPALVAVCTPGSQVQTFLDRLMNPEVLDRLDRVLGGLSLSDGTSQDSGSGHNGGVL